MTYAKLAERWTDVKGARTRYFVAGDGPPLLLVHGLGGSEPLAGLAGLGAFADRIAAVAEQEDALPAPVVGHSLGGLVVLHMALGHPAAVTKLVLAASAGLSIGRASCRERV